MFRKACISIFFILFSISLLQAKRREFIPQRVVFLESNETDQYSTYINYLINTSCKSLDSQLSIRYMKKEEYQKFQYLLEDMSGDNVKEFYFKTGTRGIITVQVTEIASTISIVMAIYQLYAQKIIVKEIEFKKNTFYNKIDGLSPYVTKQIVEAFPKIDPKTLTKDKIRLLSIVRKTPDYQLNISGTIGFSFKSHQVDLKSTDMRKFANLFGISFGYSISSKIKKLYLRHSSDFSYFFAEGISGDPKPFYTTEVTGTVFWANYLALFEAGGYFFGDALRINLGSYIGVSSLYTKDSATTLSDTLYPGLRIIPVAGFGIKPVSTVELNLSGGASINFIAKDFMPIGGIFISIESNFSISKYMFIGFQFFLDIMINPDSPTYRSETSDNHFTFTLGYKLERSAK